MISYLLEDNSIECGSGEHNSIRRLPIASIVIWPVGSMVLYSSLLIACYKPLRANLHTALTCSTAFLHQDYETQWCWWEALELARRLLLTGAVTAMIPEERAFLRLVLATLISTLHTCSIAVARPFKRVEDDGLAVVRQPHSVSRTCPSPHTHLLSRPFHTGDEPAHVAHLPRRKLDLHLRRHCRQLWSDTSKVEAQGVL